MTRFGFEGVNPDVMLGIEHRLGDHALEELYGQANPPAEASAEINPEVISNLFAKIILQLSSGDSRIEGQVTLRGPANYLHAIHQTALLNAVKELFGRLPEDEGEMMSLSRSISPAEMRQVISIFINSVDEVQSPQVSSNGDIPLMRLHVLEIERQKGVTSEEVESLKKSIKEKDIIKGRTSEESQREWQAAQLLLNIWDAMDERIQERQVAAGHLAPKELPSSAEESTENPIKSLEKKLDEHIIKAGQPASGQSGQLGLPKMIKKPEEEK